MRLPRALRPIGEARGMSKEGIKNAKNVEEPETQWFELMDELTSQLEQFAGTVGKAETTLAEAKTAWNLVSQKCTRCHAVFRVEEPN